MLRLVLEAGYRLGAPPVGIKRKKSGSRADHAASPHDLSDAELIEKVRQGSMDDYAQLYERHKVAAERLARQLGGAGDADDLVAEAFSNVLLQLRDGRGPDLSFRAYLLTTLRNLHIRRKKHEQRLHVTDDEWKLDQPVNDPDLVLRAFEDESVRRGFESLPERWQLVLWHMEVEKERPAQIAPLLGMSANSVSALAYRAREGLRQAYLRQHALDSGSSALCVTIIDQLPSYVRSKLPKRDTAVVERHLEDCRDCYAAYVELSEMNGRFAGVLAPALLGAAGLGYAESVPGGGLTISDHPWQWLKHRYFSSAAHAGPLAAKAGIGATMVVVAAAAVAVPHVLSDSSSVSETAPLPNSSLPPLEPDDDSTEESDDEADEQAVSDDEDDADVLPAALSRRALDGVPFDAFASVVEAPVERPQPVAPDPPGPDPAPPLGPDPDPEEPVDPVDPVDPEPGPLELTGLALGSHSVTGTGEESMWQAAFTPAPTVTGEPGTVTLTAVLSFTNDQLGLEGKPADGWTCDPPVDGSFFIGPDQELTCTLTWNTSGPVEPLTLELMAIDPPSGTITLTGKDPANPAITGGPFAF